ncbi:hypothetical protein [Dactylosporangium sp. NPDC005555]
MAVLLIGHGHGHDMTGPWPRIIRAPRRPPVRIVRRPLHRPAVAPAAA